MIENELLGLLCGYREPIMTAYDLLMFSVGSFVVISFLLMYYDILSRKSNNRNQIELSNPIYQSSDILLQSKNNDASFVIAKKSTSTFVKIIVFILVLYILFNPLNQYLNFDYFY